MLVETVDSLGEDFASVVEVRPFYEELGLCLERL